LFRSRSAASEKEILKYCCSEASAASEQELLKYCCSGAKVQLLNRSS